MYNSCNDTFFLYVTSQCRLLASLSSSESHPFSRSLIRSFVRWLVVPQRC